MKIHPYANLFPMCSDEEVQELADDIAKHGLRQPIVIDEDEMILDGRNRAAACVIAGLKPVYEPFVGTDAQKLAYVCSVNIHRRHLTTAQRAEIAAQIATMSVGDNQHSKKKKEGPSNDGSSTKVSTKAAAKLMKVSASSVERAKAKKKPAKAKPAVVTSGKAKPANPVKAQPLEYLYSVCECNYEFIHIVARHKIERQSGNSVFLSAYESGDSSTPERVLSVDDAKPVASTSDVSGWLPCSGNLESPFETDCNGSRFAKQLDISQMQPREGGGRYLYFEPGRVCYYDETAMNAILKVQAIAHRQEQGK